MQNDAISRSALMDFARNHVGGTVDVNDIARFPALDVAQVMHRGQKTIFLRVDNLNDFQERRIVVDDNKSKGCFVFYLDGARMDGEV